MILPEGNCKKYIKVVIGVYVLFTIVSPVITKFTGETIEVSDLLDLNKYIEEAEESAKVQNTIQDENQSSILEIYSSGIKEDMRAKIEAKGYVAKDIVIDVSEDESYRINSITITVEEKETEEDSNSQKEETTNQVEAIENVNKVEVSITEDNENTEHNSTQNEENSSEDDRNRNSLSYREKQELKQYLSGIYEVQEKNITIN